ncbi:radical SAM protein, partial [bacterium]|nr:radical SAM protein [bacterium]
VRHLVLPNHLNNTIEVLEYLSQFKKDIYISLMFQYFPAYRAINNELLNRKINKKEYERVMDYFKAKNFKNGWVQELLVS